MTPKRVALYHRVSRRDQSPGLQISELKEVAAQRKWIVAGEYTDHGVSGKRERRPELDRMMTDVRRGKVDIVACWKFDRFGRSTSHLVATLEEFRSLGVEFLSVRDAVDTSTPAGKMVFGIFAVIAEFERELIRERTIAGVAEARRRGKRLGRPPKHALDIDLALELVRGKGRSIRAAARELSIAPSIVHRAITAPPGGRCVVCGVAVLVDMHARSRWHRGADGGLCDGAGRDAVALAVPESSQAEAAAGA